MTAEVSTKEKKVMGNDPFKAPKGNKGHAEFALSKKYFQSVSDMKTLLDKYKWRVCQTEPHQKKLVNICLGKKEKPFE